MAQANKLLLLLLLAAGSQILPDPSNNPYMFPENLGASEEEFDSLSRGVPNG